MDQEKRERRQLKREIKRKGTQHRRRLLKRALADHPEEAVDDIPTVGRYRSSDFNGLDHDATRKKAPPRHARETT
jgi:hypothetical protein